MKKSNYDEYEVEQLLRSLPKVKDRQDPDELFNQISKSMKDQPKQKRKWTWTFPTLASIAAILLLAIIVPSMIQDQQQYSTEGIHTEESTAIKESQLNRDAADGATIEMAPKFNDQLDQGQSFGIAKEGNQPANNSILHHTITVIPEGMKLVTAAVPDPNAQVVIPVAFLIAENEPILDFVENINSRIGEQTLGLSESMLQNLQLSEANIEGNQEAKKVIVNMTSDNEMLQGSTNELMFLNTIKETFRHLGYEKAEFTVNGKPGLALSNYGEIRELNLEKNNQSGYLLYITENNLTYLTPYQVEPSQDPSLESTIGSMQKGNPEYGLQPSIPENVSFSAIQVDDSKRLATFTFSDVKLEDNERYEYMIDAILLTSKEFGIEQVEFNNMNINNIGKYDLSRSIIVPKAANVINY